MTQTKLVKNNDQGQIALIILTVMAIALTLGLSLSQRVIEDLEITEEEEKSAQAFSAAEGGIEEALRILDKGETVPENYGSVVANNLGIGASIEIQTSTLGGNTEFNYPSMINPGNAVVIWLREHQETGELDMTGDSGTWYQGNEISVCWQASGSEQAAVEVLYFYQDTGGGYDLSRFTFDPDAGRRSSNNFSGVDPSGCGGLDTSGTVSLDGADVSEPLFLVLRPFYQMVEIGVEGTEAVPGQGYEVVSTAQIPRSETETISRRVKVFRNWQAPFDYFYHSVFSTAGITRQ